MIRTFVTASVVLLLASALLTPTRSAAQLVPRWAVSLSPVSPPKLAAHPAFPVPGSDPALHRLEVAAAGTGTLLAGGTAAAVLSASLGAALGYQLTKHAGGEDPGLGGLAGGWLAGAALVTPVAVHILNDGRGSLPLSFTLSAGIAVVSVITIDQPIVFVASPALQAIAATVVQRKTER